MISIADKIGFRLDKKFFGKVALEVLGAEKKGQYSFSCVFIGPRDMRALNRKYRQQDKVTDILSFGIPESHRKSGAKRELGELVICPREVRKNAEQFGNNFQKEMAMVFIHGILHLIGYDHEKGKKQAKKMLDRQDKYLARVIQK